MTKIITYFLSVLYYFFFGLTLVIFHPIQWFSLNVVGYSLHRRSVVSLQFWIMRCLNIVGTRFTFSNPHNIDKNRPLIIVANHQSTYDIPPIIWHMRKHHCKFISKDSLGKGIPSVSYNLRHGGSILINRRDPIGAIKSIETFAKNVQKNNWTAVIFPEGTRSRNGAPKPFKRKGLLMLMQHMPDALVVPISINNSWKTMKYGSFPMGLGAHIKFQVHQPIAIDQSDHNSLIDLVEKTISSHIIYDK